MATDVSVQANLLSRIDRAPVTPTVRRVVVLLLIAWVCEAFDIGIVSTAVLALKELWQLTPSQVGLLAISSTLGIVIGLVPSGRLADIYGRKRVLIAGVTIFSIFTLAGGLFSSLWAVVACRFVAGLGQGAVFPIPYLMASEFLTPRRRATAIGWQNGTLTAAYSLPSAVGAIALGALPPDDSWRLPFFVGALPILLVPALIKWLPESPRYLLKSGRDDEARRLVERIEDEAGLDHDTSYVNPDIADAVEREERGGGERVPIRALLEKPYLGRAAVATLGYTGALGVWYALLTYAPTLFAQEGFTPPQALALVGVLLAIGGVGNVVQGYASDRYGRKPLYGLYALIGLIGFVTLSFVTSTGMILLVGGVAAFFGFGIFPVAKAYLAEQFPTRLRGLGTSSGESVARLVTGVALVYMLPTIIEAVGPRPIFAGAGIFLFVLMLPVLVWGRETGGMSVEESGSAYAGTRSAAATG